MKLTRSILTIPLLALSLGLTACGSDSDDNPFDPVPTETDGSDTEVGGGDADGTGTDGSGSDTDGSGSETDGGGSEADGSGSETDGTETGGTDGTETDGTEEPETVDPASDAIVMTVASDFSSSAVNIVGSSDPFTVQGDLNTGTSDSIVRAYEDKYYVIRRFESDSLAAYSISDPTTPLFEVSTNSDMEPDLSSNPHDLVFLNSSKAYLLRYGSPIVWVVNPSAADASQFKIGEIDLSAYDAAGGPEMTRGVIVEDKLYVIMQRLDDSFTPTANGYVAVIDTATDTEINTNTGDLPGIEIPAFNPTNISLDSASGTIFISAVGEYGDVIYGGDRPWSPIGGIVTLDSSDYSTSLLIDDTEETGRFDDVEIINANRGYVVATSGGVSSLDQFNPMTGRVEALGVAGISGVQIKDIAMGPAGNLWVGIASAESPKIVVINPEDNSTVTTITTSLDPSVFAFTQ